MKRPPIESLEMAATWLRSYEDDNGDENGDPQCVAVAEWLEGLIRKTRTEQALTDAAVREYGCTRKKALSAVRRLLREKAD